MADPARRFPVSRWLALCLVLGLPVALVLLVAGASGLISGRAAWILLFVLLGMAGLFAVWHTRAAWQVLRRTDEILGRESRAAADWDAFTVIGELGVTVERLRRTLLDEKGQVALQSTTADAILNALPDPVLLLDSRRQIARANFAARKFFGNEMIGHDLAVVLRHPAVLEAADSVLHGESGLASAELTQPAPDGRSFSLRVAALPAGQGDTAAVLTLHDVTALRRAEEMRADFVANASHELRTPLASLVGFIETLLGPARDDEEARIRFLGIMRDQAARMSRLIQDLLSLSQIEMRAHERPSEPVALAPLLRDTAAALQPQAGARNITLQLDLDESLPAVRGARDELLQVFQNLIDNAIKYGRPDTAVEIHLRRRDQDWLEIAVRDHGEGIPRDHLPRLTERFYRVDSARSRDLGGTGLGLAIVKHILNRHRGRLVIESEVGEGSIFSVRLPIVR
ncbi:MAG TPA: phosphate regulon sensor histidine kinase PhoR [Ferrovibrio sp.]|jgi:two-component system phosphate regulon sensor histidine kinase PhoR|uniref:phosphate regulon sensor histidine kinase PhoR n=1 Tax=Ferrovibrio sp. TaxID=1917215 RepID=UPI002B4B90B0|nr:phosphate regulon sensor histidine kinase PhoR [Ferrovibrio sp.]HLT76700.1 phosphate regulon sensor histidine kinase PhoR [Ferrovibrio sp.]